MAHQNIDERLRAVADMLSKQAMTWADRRALGVRFGCSANAIYADELQLRRDPELPSAFVTAPQRERILRRDNLTCQYCLSAKLREQLVLEHVVPAARGGMARDYNLVTACYSCNASKMSSVWVPANLDLIAAEEPDWKAHILALANRQGHLITH